MPDSELVVSDTSPLLNLALIDRLDLLEAQFSSITAPREVWDELTAGEDGIETLSERRESGFIEVVAVEYSNLFTEISQQLDLGETAAICYAIEHNAELLLLDEKEGRRVARRHDLCTTGVIGILIEASETSDVTLKDELDALRESGFWIAEDLYSEILSQVGETDSTQG